MSFDIVHWLAAFLPILALLLLLLHFHWGGDEAAVAGLCVAMIVAVGLFGGGTDLLALAVAKGMWTALSIILVIFPALLIYEVSREAGAFSVIRQGMETFTPDKVLQVLAIGWIFVDFLQGITGFGVPVVVCAPLLISMGVRPLTAVVITLLGQAWGNTFGTLGLAWEGLVGQSDLSNPEVFRATLLWTTNMLVVVNIVTGLAITWLAGGRKGVRRNAFTVVLLAAAQGFGQTGFALLNPALCNFIVATLSMGIIFIIGRLPYYRHPADLNDALPTAEKSYETEHGMSLLQAFIPYVFLVGAAVLVLLNDSLKNFLGQWKIALAFDGKTTALGFATHASSAYAPLAPLTHSGAFLIAAAAMGYICYRHWKYIGDEGFGHIVKNSLQKTIPSGIAVIGLIAMSKVMDETGQTTILAQGTAAAAGGFYPFLAPFIGLLGTFMTASNLSSNILFGGFQEQVAGMLGISKIQLLAAQTVGGGVGSILSPSKILLGTTAAGILGREGEVMGRVMGLALLLCAVFGIVVFLSYQLGW